MLMVCCSMASWMATWSLTSILSNSSMQQTPWRKKQSAGGKHHWMHFHNVAPSPSADARNTHVVGKHQSSGLDDKLVGLLVSDHSCRQTCSRAGLPAGVHRPGAELLHVPANTHTHTFKKVPFRPTAPRVLQSLHSWRKLCYVASHTWGTGSWQCSGLRRCTRWCLLSARSPPWSSWERLRTASAGCRASPRRFLRSQIHHLAKTYAPKKHLTKHSWLEKLLKDSRSADRGWWGRGWCTGCGTDSCLGSSRTPSPTPSPSSGSWCSRPSAPPPAAPYRQTTTRRHTNTWTHVVTLKDKHVWKYFPFFFFLTLNWMSSGGGQQLDIWEHHPWNTDGHFARYSEIHGPNI